jgi:hypothetical protein
VHLPEDRKRNRSQTQKHKQSFAFIFRHSVAALIP